MKYISIILMSLFLFSNVSAEDNFREIYRVTFIDLQYDDNGTPTIPSVWALGNRYNNFESCKNFLINAISQQKGVWKEYATIEHIGLRPSFHIASLNKQKFVKCLRITIDK